MEEYYYRLYNVILHFTPKNEAYWSEGDIDDYDEFCIAFCEDDIHFKHKYCTHAFFEAYIYLFKEEGRWVVSSRAWRAEYDNVVDAIYDFMSRVYDFCSIRGVRYEKVSKERVERVVHAHVDSLVEEAESLAKEAEMCLEEFLKMMDSWRAERKRMKALQCFRKIERILGYLKWLLGESNSAVERVERCLRTADKVEEELYNIRRILRKIKKEEEEAKRTFEKKLLEISSEKPVEYERIGGIFAVKKTASTLLEAAGYVKHVLSRENKKEVVVVVVPLGTRKTVLYLNRLYGFSPVVSDVEHLLGNVFDVHDIYLFKILEKRLKDVLEILVREFEELAYGKIASMSSYVYDPDPSVAGCACDLAQEAVILVGEAKAWQILETVAKQERTETTRLMEAYFSDGVRDLHLYILRDN